MKLSRESAVEVLRNPKNSKIIKEGRSYESWLRLITETMFREDITKEESYLLLIKEMELILGKEKANEIKNYIRFPLPVIDITESCLNHIYKVFDAKNSFFEVEIDKESQRKAINQFVDFGSIFEWVKKKGKQSFKNKPNMVVVIDKDSEGKPYPICVDNDRIHDIHLEEDGTVHYIAFVHSVTKSESGEDIVRYSVYDEDYYRVFVKENDNYILEEGKEMPHGLGYCPANMFLSDSINSKNPFSRKNPLSNALSKIMDWQKFDIYNHYSKHYSSFPIVEMSEQNCVNESCVNGFLVQDETHIVDGEAKSITVSKQQCPDCSSGTLIGPGLIVEIPAQQDKDDPSAKGIFRFIVPDINTVKELDIWLKTLEKEITEKTVGVSFGDRKEAMNVEQVQSLFQDKKDVLISIKDQLDTIYKWIIKTMIKSVIPEVAFTTHVDYGTEFYLYSEAELQLLFETAKKIGLPESELHMIYKQLIETKYKGNQIKIDRILLLNKLEPMPYRTIDETIVYLDKGLISQSSVVLKMNLIKFVERFEGSNGPITKFGEKMEDPNQRIVKILEIFKTYTDE